MNSRDQFLTPTAWLVVVLVTIITFGFYYLGLLPKITKNYEESFLKESDQISYILTFPVSYENNYNNENNEINYETKQFAREKDIDFRIKYPQYIGKFESLPIEILASIKKSDNDVQSEPVTIKLVIKGEIYGTHKKYGAQEMETPENSLTPTPTPTPIPTPYSCNRNLLMSLGENDNLDQYNNFGYKIDIETVVTIGPGETKSIILQQKLPIIPDEIDCIPIFVNYNIQISLVEQEDQECNTEGKILNTQSPTPENRDDQILAPTSTPTNRPTLTLTATPSISPSSPQSTSQPNVQSNVAYDCPDFCSSVDDFGVFRQSASRQLLFPPWSAGFLPLFVFGITWIMDRMYFPRDKKARKRNKNRFSLSRFVFLFISVTIVLHVIVITLERVLWGSGSNEKRILWQFLWIPTSILLISYAGKFLDDNSIFYNLRYGIAKFELWFLVLRFKVCCWISKKSHPLTPYKSVNEKGIDVDIPNFDIKSSSFRRKLRIKLHIQNYQKSDRTISKLNIFLLEFYAWVNRHQDYLPGLSKNEKVKLQSILTKATLIDEGFHEQAGLNIIRYLQSEGIEVKEETDDNPTTETPNQSINSGQNPEEAPGPNQPG